MPAGSPLRCFQSVLCVRFCSACQLYFTGRFLQAAGWNLFRVFFVFQSVLSAVWLAGTGKPKVRTLKKSQWVTCRNLSVNLTVIWLAGTGKPHTKHPEKSQADPCRQPTEMFSECSFMGFCSACQLYFTGRSLQAAHWDVFRVFFVWDFPVPPSWTLQAGPSRKPTEMFSECSLCGSFQCLPVVLYRQVPAGNPLRCFQSVLCVGVSSACQLYFTGRSQQETHWDVFRVFFVWEFPVPASCTLQAGPSRKPTEMFSECSLCGSFQCLPVVLYRQVPAGNPLRCFQSVLCVGFSGASQLNFTGRSQQETHWDVFRVFFVWEFPVPASCTLQAGPSRKPTEMFSECSLCGSFQCLPVVLYRQVPAGNPLRCFQSVLCVGVSSACQLYFTGRSQQETHWDVFRVFFVWEFPVPASCTLQAGPSRKPTEMFSECSLCGSFQCLPVVLYRQVPAGNPLRCFQSVLCVGVSSACQLYFTGRSQQETHWDVFRVFFVWEFPVPASCTLQAGPSRKPTEMFSECSLCGSFQCLPVVLYRQVPAGNPLRSVCACRTRALPCEARARRWTLAWRRGCDGCWRR